MRPSLFFARGLALAAAFLIALPSASAAPARRAKPKPKHAAPAPAAPAQDAEEAPTKPEEPTPRAEELAPAAPEAKALAAPAPAASAPPAQAEGAVSLAPGAADSEAGGEALGPAEHEALGRREAARLAAGRTEVGVSVSVDVGNRRFRYSDPVGSLLRPYKLPLAPMLGFGLEAYPLTTSDVPVLRDLGFRGRFSRAFALDSTTPEGDTIETSWSRFSGEVRERLLVPGRHPLEFGVFFGADASYFVMKSQSELRAALPSARTVALRFGLDGRVLVAGRFSVALGAAYLAVTEPGEIYERFRDPAVKGVDGDLLCALAVAPGLEARLTGRYTRYFATFHPRVGDASVAGGALDEQLQIGLGVRYAH